jgi:hypothetical protein
MLADVILKRIKKIPNFIKLSQNEINMISDSFVQGFFYTTQKTTPTFIRPKSEKLNLEKYSDSDIVFWCCRILEKPLVSIIA